MEKEFFDVFPTLLGLHATPEIHSQELKGTVPTSGDKRADYVVKYFGIAQKVGSAFGINPFVILAQAAIESGWGTSNLSKNHNNFFGVTAYGGKNQYWKGGKYVSTTLGLPFRTYDTVADGFSDFARLLVSKYNEAAKASKNVSDYARLISSSPYINEKNGDNRTKYKELIIKNADIISLIAKKYQSLYN
jgi:flagellar protein FlgJ